jgi:hypothetical protein
MTLGMTTLHGPRTELADDVLETLRGQLRGQVVGSPSPSGVRTPATCSTPCIPVGRLLSRSARAPPT